jgi:hypothetical protein
MVDVPWTWNDEHHKAFTSLQTAMASEEVLVLPISGRCLHLKMDMSGWASGAVLSQEQVDRKFRPITFESKTFKSYKLNYDTYDKELLVIM